MRGACLPFRLIFKNCGPQKQEPDEKLEALQESATPLIKLSVEHRIVGERLWVRTLHKLSRLQERCTFSLTIQPEISPKGAQTLFNDKYVGKRQKADVDEKYECL
jgi:hypothetical protein